jgi:G3E family GTPase
MLKNLPKAIIVTGFLGAGKTTIMKQLMGRHDPDKTLVIINDIGWQTNTDFRRLSSQFVRNQIRSAATGCITCTGVDQLRQYVQEAISLGYTDLLIETSGVTNGLEIPGVFTEMNIPYYVITAVDTRNFRNALAVNLLHTGIMAANLICLTKTEVLVTDPALVEIAGYVGRYNPRAAVITMSLSSELPTIPDHAFTVPLSLGGHHHHHHHHADSDGFEHGIYTATFTLAAGKTIADVYELYSRAQSCQVVRAKGVAQFIDGQLHEFSIVGQDVCDEGLSSAEPYITIMSVRKLPADLVGAYTPQTDTTKDLLRSAEVPLADTLAAIEWLLTQYPATVIANGLVQIDFEADAAYQLAKRPGVSGEMWQRCLQVYIGKRLEALAQINAGATPLVELAEAKQRLGLVLGWHASRYGADLTTEMVEQINQYAGQMATSGLTNISSMTFNDTAAEQRPEFVLEALRYFLACGVIGYVSARAAMAHCRDLAAAANKTDWVERWESAIAQL